MQHERTLTRRRAGALAIAWAMLAMVIGGRLAAAMVPAVGQPAPVFVATTSDGTQISLDGLRGRIVVLEWTNHECPFVRRHYESGNMQALQKDATGAGVVWLTVISSAPGEQGFVSGAEADALTRSRGASPSAVVLDPTGDIGRAYAAKTTPHMFVIDAAGTLVYMGAIDDQPRNAGADPAKADNHVRTALAAVKTGLPVSPAITQPYGCSIKYAQ